jgi:hypothetical protein
MSELSQSIQDDIRAAEPGWCSSRVFCGDCGHEMVAVYPVECPVADLECSCCHQQGHTILIEHCPPIEGDEEEDEEEEV